MFSLVQHSTDIQGTSESGLRHNLPVARLRLTGGLLAANDSTKGKFGETDWRRGRLCLPQLIALSAPTRGETHLTSPLLSVCRQFTAVERYTSSPKAEVITVTHLITRVASYITLTSNSLLVSKIFSAKPF